MARNMNLAQLAAETVAVFRADFPGQGPDWESDWWVEAWRIDTDNLKADGGLCEDPRFPDFDQYLEACQAEWSLIERHPAAYSDRA